MMNDTRTDDIAHGMANAAISGDNTVDERLTRLEIKVSFTDDLLDKLDAVIIRQQDQIDRLTRELQRLRHTGSSDGTPTPRNLRDDLPPHY